MTGIRAVLWSLILEETQSFMLFFFLISKIYHEQKIPPCFVMTQFDKPWFSSNQKQPGLCQINPSMCLSFSGFLCKVGIILDLQSYFET